MKPLPKSIAPYVQAGDAVIGAAVLTVVGAAVGHWLDRQIHTAPLFTMALLFVGMFGGLWRMIAKVSAAPNRPPAASRPKPLPPDDPDPHDPDRDW